VLGMLGKEMRTDEVFSSMCLDTSEAFDAIASNSLALMLLTHLGLRLLHLKNPSRKNQTCNAYIKTAWSFTLSNRNNENYFMILRVVFQLV
jgi:hypothetical protein